MSRAFTNELHELRRAETASIRNTAEAWLGPKVTGLGVAWRHAWAHEFVRMGGAHPTKVVNHHAQRLRVGALAWPAHLGSVRLGAAKHRFRLPCYRETIWRLRKNPRRAGLTMTYRTGVAGSGCPTAQAPALAWHTLKGLPGGSVKGRRPSRHVNRVTAVR